MKFNKNPSRIFRVVTGGQTDGQGTENRHIFFCKFSLRRYYATSRKVTGSIPDVVIGYFN
jgi:hypothetical protein